MSGPTVTLRYSPSSPDFLTESYDMVYMIWSISYGSNFNPALAQTDFYFQEDSSVYPEEKKIIDWILGALELLFLNKNGLKSTFNKHNRQNTINFHSKSGILMGIATDFNS